MDRKNFKERLKQIDPEDEDEDYDTDILGDIKNIATVIQIKNGKTISITIDDTENKLFIFAFTTPVIAVSNQVLIQPECIDKCYLINTIGGFTEISLLISEI